MSPGRPSDERGARPELPHDRTRQPAGAAPSLGEVEAALARALEARAVAAAQRSGAPTASERAALARMAAHMDAAASGAGGADAAVGPRCTAGASPRDPHSRLQHGAALVGCAALLGLVVWFGLPAGAPGGVPAASPYGKDTDGRLGAGPGAGPGASPDVYLGPATAPSALERFPGRVTWDDGGDGGFVRVRVFDLDRPGAPWLELETRATVFEPAGPLPARFEVCVDRAADDGLGTEVLLRKSFAAP